MAKVHPLTKVLVAVALVAVPYLLWTSPEPGPVAAVSVRDEATLVPPVTPRPTVIPSLPPLQSFAVTLERPLFAPSRRLPRQAAPVAIDSEPAPALDGAPAEPQVRFFGTMSRDGRSIAMVDAGEGVARKLLVGDDVEGWQVVAIDRDRLVLGQGDERRDFTILRSGSEAAAAGSDAAEPEAAAATEEPEVDGPELEVDEGEP